MAVQTVLQETITNFTCVGTILIYQNEAGQIMEFDLAAKLPQIVTVLDFDPITKQLTFTNEQGEDDAINLSVLCSVLEYNSQTHTITHNGVPHLLNCGRLDFDPGTCQLSYTDEKGNVSAYFLPQDQFVYSSTGCTVTILPAKGGDPVTFPVGVPAEDVSFQMLDGKVLEFTYKSKKCQVTMPNSIVGCQYTLATNTLRMIYCDGSVDEKALAKASLTCNTLEDGTQVLVFQDGCGGQKMFNIPAVKLDMDDVTLVGSVVVFTFAGDDENPRTVTLDICAIVGDNCNAHFVEINDDGSWTFIDNKLQTYTYPAPRNCCTYHGINPTALDPASPPAQPTGNYANKSDGDTAVECHPNGTSYWTCDDGTWRFDFLKLAAQEVFVGPGQPPKDGELKTWFNPVTCVVKYCYDGEWIQPTNLICQEAEPDTEKGGYTHWYKPSECCYSILCGGVWIGVNGLVMDAVIRSMCVQVGDNPPTPLSVDSDGKVVIPVPAPIVPDTYCVVVGDGDRIFPSLTEINGKLEFKLPEYPEVPEDIDLETCIRIGGTDATPIVPHTEDGKKFLDLPAYPAVPDALNFCYKIGEADPVPVAVVDGKVTIPLEPNPDIPEELTFCIRIGDADPVPVAVVDGKVTIPLEANPEIPEELEFCLQVGDADPEPILVVDGKVTIPVDANPDVPDLYTYCYAIGNEEDVAIEPTEDRKIRIPIPPVLNCDEGAPATDGSEGIFWMDPESGCLHALCGGIWKATNGQDVAG